MKKYVSIAAVLFTALVFTAAKALAISPSDYMREGDMIIWKIEGVTVSKFPVACAADVSLLSGRFNRLYDAGFKLSDMHVSKSGEGVWSLLIGDNLIFSVSRAYSDASGQEPAMAALALMSRIYEVLGWQNADKLSPAYQIRGKYETSGAVSWYGGKFIGKKFANGERFTPTHLTAAAKTLPFGTLVKVTAPSGKSVVVRVTDRFSEHRNRVIDLSHAAAELIGIKGNGAQKARIEVIGRVETVGGK